MHTIPLNAEPVFSIGRLPITNAVLATWFTIAVLIVLGLLIRRGIAHHYRGFGGGLALLLESAIDLFEDILGWEATKQLASLLGSFFIFILFANWLGLLPGFGSIQISHAGETVPLLRGATTDLNTTLALAILSVFSIQIWGLAKLGLPYFKKYINFYGPWYLKPIYFFVGLLEIVSELAKVLSFGFRLFGNLFAGEVLLSVMFGLIPLLIPSLFYGLELFVGFIQAFVFVMLTAVFLKMAGEVHVQGH